MEVYLSKQREVAKIAEVADDFRTYFRVYRVNTSTSKGPVPTLTPSKNPAFARYLAALVISPEIPATGVSVLTVPSLNPLVFVNHPQPKVETEDLKTGLQELAKKVSQKIESARIKGDLYSAIFWTSFAVTATSNGTGIAFYPILMTSHELDSNSLALVTEAAQVVKDTFGAVTCKLMDLIPQKNSSELNLAFFELAFDIGEGLNTTSVIELIESNFERNVRHDFFKSILSCLESLVLEEVAAKRMRLFASQPDKDASKGSGLKSDNPNLYGLCGIAGMYVPRPSPSIINAHPELVSFYVFPYFAAKYLLHKLQKVSRIENFQITRPFAFEVPYSKVSILLNPEINMINPNFSWGSGTFFLNSLFFVASAENVPNGDWVELVSSRPEFDTFWGREEFGKHAANVARVRLLKSFSQEVTPLPFIIDLARSTAKFWANVAYQLTESSQIKKELSQIKLVARHFCLTKPAGIEHTVDVLLFFLDQNQKNTASSVKNQTFKPLIPLEITGNLEIKIKFKKLSDPRRAGPGFTLESVEISDNTNGSQIAAANQHAFLRYLKVVIIPNFVRSITPLATAIETPPYIGYQSDGDNFHLQALIATGIISPILKQKGNLEGSGNTLPKTRLDGGPAWFNPQVVTLPDGSLGLESRCETPEGYGLTVYFFHGIKFDPGQQETYHTLVDILNAFFDLAKRSGIFPKGVEVSYVFEII